jgi:hypothetical protein
MAVQDYTGFTVTTPDTGIQFTKVTDSSSDWASVANDTYFYDKTDKLVHYKNGSGAILELFSASGGITYFTEAQNTSAPNATVYVDSLTAVSSTTNADISIVPKGTGAFTLAIPDNTTTGGNKRGTYSIDLQLSRSVNTQVAGGNYSFTAGSRNTSSDYGVSIGYNNTSSVLSASVGHDNIQSGANYGYAYGRGNTVGASGTNSFAAGFNNTVSADRCTAIGGGVTASAQSASAIGGQNNIASNTYSTVAGGQNNISSGSHSFTTGSGNTASSLGSLAMGASNTASGYCSITLGASNTTNNDNQVAIGTTNTFTGSSLRAMAFGNYNTLNAVQSMAFGNFGLINGIFARQVFSANRFTTNGDSQKSIFFLNVRTTDATTKYLTTDASGSQNALNIINLSNNSLYRYKGQIIAKQSGSVNVASWDVDGMIVRGASAGTTVLLVNNINLVQNTPAWTTPIVSAVIDAFNGVGGLSIQVNGNSATNIQWNCIIETTELIYA